MNWGKTFARNASSNLAGYVVNLIVGLLLSPFVVHSLGDALFGIWTLVRSLTGYYGILDLGLFGAVSHYVTRYITKGDEDGINRTMSTATIILCGVALFTMAITLFLSIVSPQWFLDQKKFGTELQGALLITGFIISLNFPLVLFKSIPYSFQRLEILSVIGVSTKILEAVLTVLALYLGFGVLGLAVVFAITTMIGWVAHIYWTYSLFPKLSLSVSHFSKFSIKELFGFGLWSTFINTAEKTVFFADSLLIGIFLTVEAVTYYAIGANLVPYYLALIQAITWAITPLATARNVQGDLVALREIFITGTRGTVALGSFVGTGMVLLGEDFLRLWMGEKYVLGTVYDSSATILTVLTLATFLRITQSCGFQILFGMGKVRYLAFLAVIEIVINLSVSIILIQVLGILGIALGTLAAALLVRGLLQPLYITKISNIHFGTYLVQIGRSCLPIIVTMSFFNWSISLFHDITTWWDFLMRGLLVTVVAIPVGFYSGIPQEIREKVWEFFNGKNIWMNFQRKL